MGIFDNLSETTNSNKINNLNQGTFDRGVNSLVDSLGSDWQGLNNQLIARFYPVIAKGEGIDRRYERDKSEKMVHAPILEGAEIEYQLNWQSPFEQMGTETKAPALTAMLQSGMLTDFYAQFTRSIGLNSQGETGSSGQSSVANSLKNMEGRTGITKLNSTQTFAGCPPVKCTMKLLFRAYSDPNSEVMLPIQQLIEWAMPQALSVDGFLINTLEAVQGKENWVDVLLPSTSPRLIAMEYKGRVYKPLVIEMISDPITSPTTKSGKYSKAEVSITIASLKAWDKADIKSIYAGLE